MPTDLEQYPRSAAAHGRLLQVKVQHRYFLNVGEADFETISLTDYVDPKDGERAAQQALARAARQAYDLRRFWRIEPTPATAALLRRQRVLFRALPDGFVLLAELRLPDPEKEPDTRPYAPLLALTEKDRDGNPLDVALDFAVTLTDPQFALYTPLDAEKLRRDRTPSEGAPCGWLPVIEGTADRRQLDRDGELAFDWAPGPVPAPGEAPAAPFCLLRLWHLPSKNLSLLGEKQQVLDHRFDLLLRNRRTTWVCHCNKDSNKVNPIGEHALVLHGRIDNECNRPSPTPATTVADADGTYYSHIY